MRVGPLTYWRASFNLLTFLIDLIRSQKRVYKSHNQYSVEQQRAVLSYSKHSASEFVRYRVKIFPTSTLITK